MKIISADREFIELDFDKKCIGGVCKGPEGWKRSMKKLKDEVEGNGI